MSTTVRTSPHDLRRRLEALRTALGIICLGLGILVLAWPGLTLLIVALLFGTQLVVAGLVRVVLGAQHPALSGHRRALTVVLGALTMIAGVVCLVHPGTSLLIVIWSVAFGWFADGISELAAGVGPEHQSALQRAITIFFGISSVIGAALIVTFPGASLLLFSQIGGVLLIIFGVIILASYVRSRPDRGETA